jgi:hypothetical protein
MVATTRLSRFPPWLSSEQAADGRLGALRRAETGWPLGGAAIEVALVLPQRRENLPAHVLCPSRHTRTSTIRFGAFQQVRVVKYSHDTA